MMNPCGGGGGGRGWTDGSFVRSSVCSYIYNCLSDYIYIYIIIYIDGVVVMAATS